MNITLTNLQSKSDQEKTALAIVASVAITVLLFIGWGYNFAHSGKISNLASSAAGVAGMVDEAKLGETFNTALEQLKDIGTIADTKIESKQNIKAKTNTEVSTEQNSVGAKHINVFNNTSTKENL